MCNIIKPLPHRCVQIDWVFGGTRYACSVFTMQCIFFILLIDIIMQQKLKTNWKSPTSG